MNPINTKNNASYNFVAPGIEADADKKVEVVFPTAEVVEPAIESNTAIVAVNRQTTIVKLGSVSADQTLVAMPATANLNVGAVVAVNWTSDSTARNVAVKVGSPTADTAVTLAGTASTAVTKQLMWDGAAFLAI